MYFYTLLVIVLVILAFVFWQWALIEHSFFIRYGKTEAKGELNILMTAKAPYVEYTSAKPEKLYTIIVADPDAPSPKHRDKCPWRHMAVVDIPGHKLLDGIKNIEGAGKILTPYNGPNPPAHSGPHRYEVKLLEQQSVLIDPKVPQDRRNWNMEAFIKDNNLTEIAEKNFIVEKIN